MSKIKEWFMPILIGVTLITSITSCVMVIAIAEIKNPSEEVQLAAVKEDVYALYHIENPSEALQLFAVKEHYNAISLIENPSEEIQLAAVNQDAAAIQFIKNPSETLQLAVEAGLLLKEAPAFLRFQEFQ